MKKFAVILLAVLLFCSPVWAVVRTSNANGDWTNAGTWDTGVPQAGDSAIIDGHAVVLDANSNALIGFTMTSGTLTGGSNTIPMSAGTALYTAGTVTSLIIQFTGDGNLDWDSSGNKLEELIVDNTKTCTLTSNSYIQKVSGLGDIAPTAVEWLYFWMAADNFFSLGGTSTCILAYSDSTETSRNSGTEAITGSQLLLQRGNIVLGANITGTSLCSIGSGASSMALDLGGFELAVGSTFSIKTAATGTLSVDFNGGTIDAAGNVDLTGITITDTATGGIIECAGDFVIDSALPDGVSVVLNGTGDVSANVSLNRADLTINTAGTHTFITNQVWDDITGTSGTLDLGAFSTALGGTFNGSGITVTAGTAARIAVGDNSVAPKLINVTAGSPVDASGVLDGGGNSINIRFPRGMVGGGVF